MGSSFVHNSTTTSPMDLQPLSFAPSDAAAHGDAILTYTVQVLSACLQPYQCLLWLFCSTIGAIWDLPLSITQQLHHLWTSNHFHSLPLMQLHMVMQY